MKAVKLVNLFGIDFKRFSIVGWKHEVKSKFRFTRDSSEFNLLIGRYAFDLHFNTKGGH